MVSNSRATLGARGLRYLNEPHALRVRTDAYDRPLDVQRRGWPHPRPVERIQDEWRIDDEWWRATPISRHYYVLLLADGTLLTAYHDLLANTWYEQKG